MYLQVSSCIMIVQQRRERVLLQRRVHGEQEWHDVKAFGHQLGAMIDFDTRCRAFVRYGIGPLTRWADHRIIIQTSLQLA